MRVRSLGGKDALEKEMATHSSALAWRIPGTGEPGGLMLVQSLGWEDALEKEMATHSSILAWEIPWTEETCRVQSTGSCKESDTT